MAYVRGRRLESAMRRLLVDRDVSLTDLAFDSGFDSQEAFTRAFARAFGQTPGRFRRTGAEPLMRRRRPTMETPTIHQSIETLPGIRLAGLSKHFTPSTTAEMGRLWQRFTSHMGFDGQLGANETYGVFCKRHARDGSFDFFAAVRIAAACSPPEPLETIELPAGTYLVFKQMLRTGELHPQMMAATEEIWSRRLPRSGRRVLDAPDFQIYPTDFKVEEGGYVAHYLPDSGLVDRRERAELHYHHRHHRGETVQVIAVDRSRQ